MHPLALIQLAQPKLAEAKLAAAHLAEAQQSLPADLLGDYTFRTIFIGAAGIGLVAGTLGAFAYLRKQALLCDVVAHASFLGVLVAFVIGSVIAPDDPRNLPLLLVGAGISGLAAVHLVNWLTRATRLHGGTAMAVVITCFFGAGMLVLRHITDTPYPRKGGIGSVLLGNASQLTSRDVQAICISAVIVLVTVAIFMGYFAWFSFDRDHAALMGVPVRCIDAALYSGIVLATVIGINAMGMILMVALVITPAAAARQWVRSVNTMVPLAGFLAALGAIIGTYCSMLWQLPTGPIIVLVLVAILGCSLVGAPTVQRWRTARTARTASASNTAPFHEQVAAS